jgi:prolipoprotein diacylglyceryl transferase
MTPTFIPSPTISYFNLGPLQIHFYALWILTGIVLAVIISGRRLQRAVYQRSAAVDMALWGVPFGIVGGRLYHVLTHPGDYFYPGADLWRVLYVWEGGIAIFGAVVLGIIGLWIGARRAHIPLIVFADALAPGMLVAQAVGRLGNYFNQELYGSPTTLPWGLQIDPHSPAFPPGLPAGTLFHPLFLYELVWNLLGALLIIIVERTAHHEGKSFTGTGVALGMYLVWYGFGRAWFEYFRLDPTEWAPLGIKINLLTAVAMAAIGAVILLSSRRRRRELTREPAQESEPVTVA